jgi:hypothetical protein
MHGLAKSMHVCFIAAQAHPPADAHRPAHNLSLVLPAVTVQNQRRGNSEFRYNFTNDF